MEVLKRLNIGKRLGIAFAILLALLCLVVVIAGLQIGKVHDNVAYFTQNTLPSLKVVERISRNLATIRRLESNHLMVPDPSQMAQFEQRIGETRKDLDGAFADYGQLVSDADDRQRLERTQAAVTAYLAHWNTLHGLSRRAADDPAAAQEARALLFGDSLKSFMAADKEVETLWAFNSALADRMAAASDVTYSRALQTLAVIAVLSIGVGLASGMVITRSITQPIGQAVEVAQAVAGGDLRTDIRPSGSDESARLLRALQAMQASLTRVIGTVREGSDSVATASAQIAQGNADLSQRTEEQASALEETAASMEQLGSTVNQNADSARQANQLAQGARDVAVRGGEVVGQVVTTMQGINDSSRKIADIISVIDGIAFQTNILALNAAVEAARAGEQGRGFAVVAGEVRTLAQRSAEAAREIKSLITASVERVEQGTTLVDEAGHTMQEIVAAIRRVSDIVGEISAASTEQSAGVAQVGEAVSQMDQTTQQNAALVEESAAAAESLKQQALQLAAAVSVFKLSDAAVRPAARPAPTPSPAPAVVRASFGRPPAAPRPAAQAAHVPAGPAPARTGTDDWEAF